MKRILLCILLYIITIAPLFCDQSDDAEASSLDNKVINKVLLKGLKKAKRKEVDAVMMVRDGMALDLSLVEQDYLKLMELNYFEDITISTEDTVNADGVKIPGKINLIYEFHEKPTVAKILFKGNKNIGVGFLLGDVTVKSGDIVDKGAIITDMLAIENKYKEKGFNYVKVDYDLYQNDSLKERNQVYLTFDIDEGPETYISEIEIDGNSSFTAATLKSKMKTKERKFFGIQKGSFQENVFYEDIDNLMTFYRDQGYYKVDILKPEINRFTIEEKGEKKETLKIVIQINEGKQYIYGGMEIVGNKIFTSDDLTYSMKLRQGQTFSYTKYQIDMYNLNMKYRNAGYIETRIEDTPLIDEEKNIISFRISIRESKRSYIEAVYFRGNEKTKTYVLERAVYTKEGDILDQSNLEASRTSLMNLGFFNNVTYEIQQGSKSGLLKVIYIVEEKLTADFKFGLQLTTSDWDVSLFGEVAESDFLGRQLSMSAKVDLSIYKQGVELKLTDPWFMGKPVSLGGSVKIYHNWTNEVLRKLTVDDYLNYGGSESSPDEDDIRDYYDDEAGSYVYENLNYIGADGTSSSWANMGLHDIEFESGISAGYRFLDYFSVSSSYTLTPIYTFLPSISTLSSEEYKEKISEIYSDTYKEELSNNNGWSIKSKISTTFSIATTTRKINPYDGFKFSVTTAYTWGSYDSFSVSSYFTYYLKLLQLDFNNWIFNNVLVINSGASFIFPGFRNLGGELNGESTAGKGPILYDDDALYVDGYFIGRGWGSSVGTTSGYSGKLTNKTGYARFDGSLEYRVPIQEQYIWFAAFIDVVNLVVGPTKKYAYTDSNGNVVTSDGDVVYATDDSDAWMWWEQLESNRSYNSDMTNWYGLENWYGSVGVGFQLTIPQLPLSFYVVKRFQVNYNGGFEWCGNVANSPNLDFVLSMVGVYF